MIQFDYGGKTYDIHTLSHNNFSSGDFVVQQWVAGMIEYYIENEKLHKEGALVTNIRLFGRNGELIFHRNDFTQM